MEDTLSTYTFLCLAQNQVATVVDVQALEADSIRAHAFILLREHASAASVEIWKDEALIDTIARDGVRALGRQDDGEGAEAQV
jgi:hypothetical protein